MDNLLWTNSGDSHFIEPPNLFKENLPPALADRLPRSEKVSDSEEIVHIDGRSFRRQLPRPPKPSTARAMMEFQEAMQQGGAGRVEGLGPARAPRRPRGVGRGRVPVARAVVRPDRRPAPGVGSGQGAQRPRPRRAHPHVAALRADGHAAVAVGGAVHRGSTALRRPRLPRRSSCPPSPRSPTRTGTTTSGSRSGRRSRKRGS